MSVQRYSVLLVEDNEADATFIGRSLKRATEAKFDVQDVAWLNTALTAIAAKHYDAVLLDLSLPDSQGIDTVVAFTRAAPELPVIVMTGYDDMATGIQSVRYGAQDYIIKGDVQDRTLERALVYAIERKRNDFIGRKLLANSIENVTDSTGGSALISGHLSHFADFIRDIRNYISRNAPAHVENVEAIIKKNEIDVVLREVRSLARNESAHRTKPGMRRVQNVTEMAQDVVRNISSPEISVKTIETMPPTSAKDLILSAIESSGQISEQYASSEDNRGER